MNTKNAGGLVWFTRVLIALSLPAPLLAIVFGRVRIPTSPGSLLDVLLRVLFGIYAAYWFLLWITGRIVCGVLATLTILVGLRPGIDPRTRAITVAAGSITCCLLLWWVTFVKYQW